MQVWYISYADDGVLIGQVYDNESAALAAYHIAKANFGEDAKGLVLSTQMVRSHVDAPLEPIPA